MPLSLLPLSVSFTSTNLKKKIEKENALLKGQKTDISSCMFEMFHEKLCMCVWTFSSDLPHIVCWVQK